MIDLEQKISRGEVYYITSKFDTVGSEQRSGRPAVIVSNNANNEHSECVEVCYLTLQEKTPLPTHVFIDRGPCVNSTILCEQITTISKERVGDYMCRIPDDIEDKVDEALAISLGLTLVEHPVSCSSKKDNKESELQAYIDVLHKENESLIKDIEALKENANRADMYERMYNDLLDRLMRR